jgi:hypothetical protein
MFKWLGKQFAYGQILSMGKRKIKWIVIAVILLILVSYIHSQYLNYIEFKSNNDGNYIGIIFYN